MSLLVLITGSSSLEERDLVSQIVRHVQAHGWRVLTGCGMGIDADVRHQCFALSVPCEVYARGAADGSDWGPLRANWVNCTLWDTGGFPVHWSADGKGDLEARIAARTQAMVEAADWVVVIAATDDEGSAAAIRHAEQLGKRWKEYRR